MIKGIPFELLGTTYIIPPLNLSALEAMQDKLEAFEGGTDGKSITTVIDATLSALKRNYPEMTRDQVADMLDVGNMQDVMQAVMDVSGLKRKALEAGEAKPGEA